MPGDGGGCFDLCERASESGRLSESGGLTDFLDAILMFDVDGCHKVTSDLERLAPFHRGCR